MPASIKQLFVAAIQTVPRVTAEEARSLIACCNALVVDVRDETEVAKTGKIKGAVNVARGLIEFRADADTPYYDAAFQKDRPVILYSASGGQAALAGNTLKAMGYERVHNLGSFEEATQAGLETEPA